MYQLCISGKGSSQKRGNCQKNKAEYSGRYTVLKGQTNDKKTLEEVQIVS